MQDVGDRFPDPVPSRLSWAHEPAMPKSMPTALLFPPKASSRLLIRTLLTLCHLASLGRPARPTRARKVSERSRKTRWPRARAPRRQSTPFHLDPPTYHRAATKGKLRFPDAVRVRAWGSTHFQPSSLWAKTPPSFEGLWKNCHPRASKTVLEARGWQFFTRVPRKGGVLSFYTGFARFPHHFS